MRLLPLLSLFNCSWNYRFDSYENHFNIVYPDKNAVYFGMVIPPGSSEFRVVSNVIHPVATYFSIQVYEIGGVAYHFNDAELLTEYGLTHLGTPYDLQLNLTSSHSYFALFRIYDSRLQSDNYWAGIPPKTLVDGHEYLPCDIEYNQQGNISTNFTQDINPETGTVCANNDEFMFMSVPPGSLTNADANYMIACIAPAQSYKVYIKLPSIMCSLNHGERPHIDDEYDLRYASLSLVSTSAPRPTIFTYKLPCNITEYEVNIDVPNDVVLPALLYRQLLPNANFAHSIERAKQKCDRGYECIHAVMGEYYPKIYQTT
jgi:hypothetical protein